MRLRRPDKDERGHRREHPRCERGHIRYLPTQQSCSTYCSLSSGCHLCCAGGRKCNQSSRTLFGPWMEICANRVRTCLGSLANCDRYSRNLSLLGHDYEYLYSGARTHRAIRRGVGFARLNRHYPCLRIRRSVAEWHAAATPNRKHTCRLRIQRGRRRPSYRRTRFEKWAEFPFCILAWGRALCRYGK